MGEKLFQENALFRSILLLRKVYYSAFVLNWIMDNIMQKKIRGACRLFLEEFPNILLKELYVLHSPLWCFGLGRFGFWERNRNVSIVLLSRGLFRCWWFRVILFMFEYIYYIFFRPLCFRFSYSLRCFDLFEYGNEELNFNKEK